MCPSEAKLLSGHLPAVTAGWVGGPLGVGGSGTCSRGPWKEGPWRKDTHLGDSCLQPCAHLSGHLTLPAVQGLWGMAQPNPAGMVPGTHVVCEVGQQVLWHVITVEQSEDNLLQVILVDEAVLVKICKEEAECERRWGLSQPPRSPGSHGPTEPPCPGQTLSLALGEPGTGKQQGLRWG